MQNPMTPIDIARQALKQLATSKVAPTPDNFRKVYDEIAGTKSEDESAGLAQALERVLKDAAKQRPKYLKSMQALNVAVKKHDWKEAENQLRELLPAGATGGWGTLIRSLVRQLEASHKGLTTNKKKEGLERVLVNFENDPEQLLVKVQALIASWGAGAAVERSGDEVVPEMKAIMPEAVEKGDASSSNVPAGALALLWRDLLVKTLEIGLISQLKYIPELARGAEVLLEQARQANTEKEVVKLSEAFKSYWYKLEVHTDAQYRLHEELLHLLRLLVDNMSELVVDDKWLSGQTAIIRDIISKPLDIEVLYDAESGLKELIFKQGKLKHGLAEAKDTLKQMASTFVERLGEMTRHTGEFHQKIEGYQEEIRSTEDITDLNILLDRLMMDTRAMQLDALRSHEDLKESQKKVDEAEQRIRQLTTELDQASEMAHNDYLTGALNRRGMNEALEREFSRCDRTQTRLCVAIMDIDHFKKLNDSLGHEAGDVALTHLAKVTKSALRPTDELARYGGEEFVIILPETEIEEGTRVMARVQRELTKNFFLHNNERVLITFSAGVAERLADEPPVATMKRADMALYEAKHSGRNRVVGAE
ncbi:MAG: GGDEF domain-containing protein [Methylophilaceae bacterium]